MLSSFLLAEKKLPYPSHCLLANHAGAGRAGALITKALWLSASSACRSSSRSATDDPRASVPDASRHEYQWVVSQYERVPA